MPANPDGISDNKGKDIIQTGGTYDSYLQLQVVKKGQKPGAKPMAKYFY